MCKLSNSFSGYFNKKITPAQIAIFAFLFFSIYFAMHLLCNFSSDDFFFANKAKELNVFDFVITRYNTWSSRLVIEGLLIIFSQHITIWRIVDSCFLVLCVFSITKLIFGTLNCKRLVISFLVFSLYPFNQMQSAGFCATTLNYLWPSVCLVVAFIPIRYAYDNQKIPVFLFPISFLCLIFSLGNEQCISIAFFASLVLFCVFIFILKEKKYKKQACVYLLIIFILSILAIFFVFTCPGNELRKQLEVDTWFPLFYETPLFTKIALFLVGLVSQLLNSVGVVLVFSLSLFLFCIYRKEHIACKIYSGLVFLFIFSLFLLRFYYQTVGYESMLFNFNLYIKEFSLDPSLLYLHKKIIIFAFLTCVLLFIDVVVVFNKKCYIPVVIIAIAFVACAALVVSPTVLVSGDRTKIFMYGALFIIIIYIYDKVNNHLRIPLLFVLAMCISHNIDSTLTGLIS